jgi:hypothetical protein
MDGLLLFPGLLAGGLGKPLHDRVEQLVHPAAMLGAEWEDVEASPIELAEIERFLAPVGIDLVGGEEDGLAAPAQKLGQLAIGRGQSLDSVDDQDDGVRLAHGRFRLLAHGANQLLLGPQREAARIHHPEAPAALLRLGVLPIPRDAGHVLDDGQPPAHDAVEQG